MFIVAHKPYNKTAISTSVGTGYSWFDVMLCSEVEGGLGGEQVHKRLRLFVPAAAELSRQREATQLGPKHQLSMVRAALRLGRQVHAFPNPNPTPAGPPPCPLLAPPHPSDALCHPVVSHASQQCHSLYELCEVEARCCEFPYSHKRLLALRAHSAGWLIYSKAASRLGLPLGWTALRGYPRSLPFTY